MTDKNELIHIEYTLNRLSFRAQEFIRYINIANESLDNLNAEIKLMKADEIEESEAIEELENKYLNLQNDHYICIKKISELKQLKDKIEKFKKIIEHQIASSSVRYDRINTFNIMQLHLGKLIIILKEWQKIKTIVIVANTINLSIAYLSVILFVIFDLTKSLRFFLSGISFTFFLVLVLLEFFIINPKPHRLEYKKAKIKSAYTLQTKVTLFLGLIATTIMLISKETIPFSFIFITILMASFTVWIQINIFKLNAAEGSFYNKIDGDLKKEQIFRKNVVNEIESYSYKNIDKEEINSIFHPLLHTSLKSNSFKLQ